MNLLRRLVDEKLFAEKKEAALLEAALRVQRAGLAHLVGGDDLTEIEVDAMAVAAETVAVERVLLSRLSRDELVARFDGGEASRKTFLRELLQSCRGGET